MSSRINFRWPAFFESIGLSSVLSGLPVFDETHPLFVASVATLCANEEKEVLFYVYDRLFTEALNQINDLPEIKVPFLLQAIKEQCQKAPLGTEQAFSPTLDEYEVAFTENAPDTMHDLILYLAWDQMCVWMGRLFDYQSTDLKFINGIAVLKECLIESYEHIKEQGKTIPSLERMNEALFFYDMREENLQTHTPDEWEILTQKF